jgi:O-antigen/teichoic acid export membrane protein
MLSLGLNLAVQVLLIRYLAKTDYGAFAYAIALVSMGTSITVLGLDKAFSRFVPMYHEREEFDKVFGAIAMSAGSVLGLGLAVVLVAYGFQSLLVRPLIDDPRAAAILLVLIALVPLHSLDCLLEAMLAVFGSPRSIFLRRHVVAPGLKLLAVVLVILFHGDVYFLAFGYLASGALGTAICLVLWARLLRDHGWLRHLNLRNIHFPIREMLGFSLPLLSSNAVFAFRITFVVILLEIFHATTGVAEFRCVLPIARLNRVVYQSFQFLFTPIAARLLAQDNRREIDDLYWQTAAWITVFTFPVFAVSFSLAQPLTVMLFGASYADSGIVLCILSLGYFCHASLGYNALTLRVFGKVRSIFLIDAIAAGTSIAASLILIPRYGAVGGAITTAATLIIHNILLQMALVRTSGISSFHRRYANLYATIVVVATVLLWLQWLMSPPIYVGLFLAASGSLLVFWINSTVLDIEETFPELLRFGFVRYVIGHSGNVA